MLVCHENADSIRKIGGLWLMFLVDNSTKRYRFFRLVFFFIKT